MVSDDGSATAPKLVEALTAKGWQVVVISYGDVSSSHLPPGIPRVVIKETDDTHIKQQLTTITKKYGAIAAFIHLHPAFASEDPISYPEADRAIVKQVFLTAKHLKKSLMETAIANFSCFITVTRLDGCFGLAQNSNYSPISGGLSGLTKSLNQEWQPVYCRAIDLSQDLDPQTATNSILAEIHDPNRYLSEVGYTRDLRSTLTI